MNERGRRTAPILVEITATLLLAVTAVTTAWCGYQATRWNGEQAKTAAAVSATRFEASRSAGLANLQTEVDVATFSQWVDAFAQDERELANFYRARFREEFRPVVEAWIATRPLRNPDAPLTPFAMTQYKLEASAEAARLDQQAEDLGEDVRSYIQHASNYVLGVLLCSVALFFAGISTKLVSSRLRRITVAVGWLVYLGTVTWVSTFPISVAV